MKKGYHKTKSGKTAKKGLYYNINKRKKAGTSRTKKKSTTIILTNVRKLVHQEPKRNLLLVLRLTET
jgi:hypothetical protein